MDLTLEKNTDIGHLELELEKIYAQLVKGAQIRSCKNVWKNTLYFIGKTMEHQLIY